MYTGAEKSNENRGIQKIDSKGGGSLNPGSALRFEASYGQILRRVFVETLREAVSEGEGSRFTDIDHIPTHTLTELPTRPGCVSMSH